MQIVRLHLSNWEYFSGRESCTSNVYKYLFFPSHKKNQDNFRVCGRRPCVQNAILKAARADYRAGRPLHAVRNWEKQILSRYSSWSGHQTYAACSTTSTVRHVNVCRTEQISTTSHIHDALSPCSKMFGG